MEIPMSVVAARRTKNDVGGRSKRAKNRKSTRTRSCASAPDDFNASAFFAPQSSSSTMKLSVSRALLISAVAFPLVSGAYQSEIVVRR